MGTFNGFTFGGSAGSSVGAVGVPLLSILKRAYRIAGITKLVGTTLQDDWFTEAVDEMNAMVGGLNCNRLNIFTIAINSFPCGNSQKAFTIGPGATFDMARPQSIQTGVIVMGNPATAGVVRMPPMYQMNDEEWSLISLQDVPNGVPLSFYYDGNYDPATGWGTVYLWTQTAQSYYVELYTWQAVPTFATKDDIFAMPPGYEDHFVYAMARRLAALNPHQANMTDDARRIAREALKAIQKLNAPVPKLFRNDAANVGNTGRGAGGRWDYRIGSTR